MFRFTRAWLLVLLVCCVFLVTFVMLSQQPVVSLDRASGLYQEEIGPPAFRWTSSQAEFALVPYSGSTRIGLDLKVVGLPGRPEVPVRVETDSGSVGTVVVTPQSRHFQIWVPPGATFLRLHAPVARSAADWRWLGVQVSSISATPSGLRWVAILQALALSLGGVALAWALALAAQHGYGGVAALTLVGLALRLLWINDTPPMIHRDEAVSLVDAWYLAQTGRDHLRHFLPLAAFEGYGDWISPLLTYLLLPWVALFGPQPLVARFVTAVFGTLAIPAIYGLGKELRVPALAICAAAVTAISPWQIFLSRVAIPPALVATTWTLCLWAAVRFVRHGRYSDATWLALAAGLALYAYPTMKMAVPLLVLLAATLALLRHGWRAAARWWLPAIALGLFWLPFAASTLLNPASGARFDLVSIKATSVGDWLARWWGNYTVYFKPNLYFVAGGIRKIVQGLPDHGLALGAEIVPLLGVLGLPAVAIARRRDGARAGQATQSSSVPIYVWLLLLGAILIAPLPASLTTGNPHAFRASPIAPLYAIVVGIGAATEWIILGWLPRRARAVARVVGALALAVALAWQSSAWFADLLQNYPSQAEATWFFADREIETMRLVAEYAPRYDEIWMDTSSVGRPYIFVLAAQAVTPAETQAELIVERQPPAINSVVQIGRYHFVDFPSLHVPLQLPVLEALPTNDGRPGYLIQEWKHGDRHILIVRGMIT